MGKNSRKYESYKFSFERIDEAIEAKFFLEAVMIEESVISDRLLSVLVKNSYLKESERTRVPNFATLINRSLDLPVPFEYASELNEWRQKRNKVAHAIVKSLPGEATISTGEFKALARDAAKQGRKLCDAVKKWSRVKQAPGGSER